MKTYGYRDLNLPAARMTGSSSYTEEFRSVPAPFPPPCCRLSVSRWSRCLAVMAITVHAKAEVRNLKWKEQRFW
jgi:hypothetical protein